MSGLLSEHWYAVRQLQPGLRDGVQVLHRRLRGRPWVLLCDPVSQRFHRVTPRVWSVLSLLDGRRTLDQVWEQACAHATHEGAITQSELVQLLANLHQNDLLRSQTTPDAAEVLERYERQRRQKFKQGWLNPMSLRLPLLYPDAWFSRQAGWARRLFSLPVLVLWLVLVAPAAMLAGQHWDALTHNLADRVLSANNLVLLWFVYPLVKAVHEWAHGMAVKAWGGTVREMGLMFILFTPVPYVDASASYRFPSKWARAMVAAAGIMAELAIGAVAMYVWVSAESGLVTTVAYNVLLVAGASTLLVNGNPLMRYDGYYLLCDLLELPNLAQRAGQYRTYLIDRYVFGSPDAQPPTGVDGERTILSVYGVLAPLYQLFITLSVIWFVASEYLLVGVLMALYAAWNALVMPLWKGWRHLRQAGSLARRRGSALRRSAWVGAGVLAFLTLVPMPFHAVHQGVVWLPDEAIVRAPVPGHVRDVRVQVGSAVQAGQPLLQLDSPELLADLGDAAGGVAQTAAALRQAEFDAPAQAVALRKELDARQHRLDEADRRVRQLDVAAGVSGRWVPAQALALEGQHVHRGDVIGYVVDGPARLVRVAVTQDDLDLIRSRLTQVDVRLARDVHQDLSGRLRRQVPGGEFDLVSPALGTVGGGEIAVDPGQNEGRQSLQRVFDLEVALDRPTSLPVFGDRAYVRFDLGATPLLWQWGLRLRQLFLARLAV